MQASLTAITAGLLDGPARLEQEHLQVAPHHATTLSVAFCDGLANTAPTRGASFIGAGWVHLKRRLVRLVHASTFVSRQRGTQRRISFDLAMRPFIEAPMEQLSLSPPLMGRLAAPSIAPTHYVTLCKTYREAVRMCWALRRVHNLTQRMLACEADLRPQLISDYLNSDDGPQRRDLPADRIALFESVVGNSLISQWVASRAHLTVLEEIQASRAA